MKKTIATFALMMSVASVQAGSPADDTKKTVCLPLSPDGKTAQNCDASGSDERTSGKVSGEGGCPPGTVPLRVMNLLVRPQGCAPTMMQL